MRTPIRSRRSGTTAAEFALILPTFVMLLMTMMDFGWLFFQRATLDMAAAAGCRAGALIDPGEGDTRMADVSDAADQTMRWELWAAGAGDCQAGSCWTDVIPYGDPPGRSIICVVGRQIDPLIGLAVGQMRFESSIAVRMEWQRWPN